MGPMAPTYFIFQTEPVSIFFFPWRKHVLKKKKEHISKSFISVTAESNTKANELKTKKKLVGTHDTPSGTVLWNS